MKLIDRVNFLGDDLPGMEEDHILCGLLFRVIRRALARLLIGPLCALPIDGSLADSKARLKAPLYIR